MTTPSQNYRTIPLTRGQVAIVDEADFDWLNQWKWHAYWDSCVKGYYALRSIYNGIGNSPGLQSMHREILRLEKGDSRRGDHIDGNTLDNRRHNLRVATSAQNSFNRKIPATNTSGYKGVSWNKDTCKWRATIGIAGKRVHLGLFESKEDAGEAYAEAAKIHFGEFASKRLAPPA